MKAVHHAVEPASNSGASVELVHVVPLGLTIVAEGSCTVSESIEKMWENQGREILDRAARGAHDQVSITSRIEKGYVSDVILKLATKGHYKMIVMGSKARGLLERILWGSVSREVLDDAPCPVLVVH